MVSIHYEDRDVYNVFEIINPTLNKIEKETSLKSLRLRKVLD